MALEAVVKDIKILVTITTEIEMEKRIGLGCLHPKDVDWPCMWH
jgi:hypothetical protein